MTPVVLCLDAAFSCMGYAIAELLHDGEEILEVGLIETKKAKTKGLVSSDNVRRAREIYAGLMDILARSKIRPSLICVETMSFPQNYGSAVKIALSWGVICSFAEANKLPIVGASPQEIKKVLCGKNNASKEEVQAEIKKRFGDRIEALHSKLSFSKQEHPYDALAALQACLRSDLVILARQAAVR